ncbi:MAG: hypothetical protein EA411_10255 [Saprospirales bacterium]|nr:MAG: hypothetical protein EA411_10255 [Saprospirales bacterium]
MYTKRTSVLTHVIKIYALHLAFDFWIAPQSATMQNPSFVWMKKDQIQFPFPKPTYLWNSGNFVPCAYEIFEYISFVENIYYKNSHFQTNKTWVHQCKRH